MTQLNNPPGADATDEQPWIDELQNKPSTFSPPAGMDVQGFTDEQIARQLGEIVADFLRLFGKILNLELLHRVVIAHDYAGALRDLDRGVATRDILIPTKDDVAEGVAMTPAILVDGKPRSVMVLNASHMMVLGYPDRKDCADFYKRVVYTLAHEAAHVHDLGIQARAFPNVILSKQLSYRQGTLHRFGAGCWDEYIASRLSAFIGGELITSDYAETFCAMLRKAKPEADAAIRQYRMHGDVGRIATEATEPYRRLLVYGSYLIGHVDGLGSSLEEAAPTASELVKANPYFQPLFGRLASELRKMHETYGCWSGFEVYEPLHVLAYDLLKVCGLDIQDRPDGKAYIDIPLRPETTPNMEEQVEFLLSRVPKRPESSGSGG